MSFIQSIILAIVEGLTEYLPVSSTGHIIIASSLMGIQDNLIVKNYTIIVQFGAILAVVVLYWRRFFNTMNFYYKLVAGMIPAAIIGLSLEKKIDELLGSVVTVGVALLLGGIVLLFIDGLLNPEKGIAKVDEVSYKQAIKVGFFQCLALVPGVSRSASTIIGGMVAGFNRKLAAEFSFFLGVPTLVAATCLKTFHMIHRGEITADQIQIFVIGNIISFFIGAIAIRGFIHYLTRHGFRMFGYYRVAAGIVILVMHFFNLGL